MKKVKFVRAMVYIKEKGRRKPTLALPRIQVEEDFFTYPEKVKSSIVFTELSGYYGEDFVRLESFETREGYLLDGHIFTPEHGIIN